MHTREARNQTEIDLLPPFGEPEVITTGDAAVDAAFFGAAAVTALSYLSSN